MTGVVEIAAVSALASYAYRRTQQDQEREETKLGLELYAKYFAGRNLFEASSGQVTLLASSLPRNLHAQAAASIQVIEAYQQKRRKTFLGFSSNDDCSGDMRSRVLEEMKQWLVTLSSEESLELDCVQARLRYCTQFLLRPGVFPTSSEFLGVVAQVCTQLEGLLRTALAGQNTAVQQLTQIVALSGKLAAAFLPMLLFVLPTEAALPKGQGEVSAGALRSAEWPRFEVCRLLRALLATEHFEGEGHGEPLGEVLEALNWEHCSAESGLREGFEKEARQGFLELVFQLDRALFFLKALKPYQSLAAVAGDMGMCWLREGLTHLLQELEKALLQLHKARLNVMRAAKLQLQALAKAPPKAASSDYRWMQGLRNVDEGELSEVHKGMVKLCSDVRLGITMAKEGELSAKSRRQLGNVLEALQSADFQARCSVELRQSLERDMKGLKQLGNVEGAAIEFGA